MFGKETDSFAFAVQHALSLPIRARCAELTVLLDRASLVELYTFYPILIENIFGPQGTLSWGLRTSTDQSDDFRQLHHFLSPQGPLFKLIYTLLKDIGTKYEFSLSYLPQKIKQYLENASHHPFYADLIQFNAQTKQAISLLLNPFDYYFFHFAYHLINPWHQRTGSTVNSWNTVYYSLCCDYVIHFLPTEPGKVVLPIIYYTGKNPKEVLAPATVKTLETTLIKANNLAKSADESFHQNLDRHPRNEIWRSETVLTVFTDFWLHNDLVNVQNNDLSQTLNSPNLRLLHCNELPTGEYMRIVRVLLKQLHSFSASAKADDTFLAELKKVAIPMVQGKVYVFLRNLIHRWPLDGSFRLVLELWLTYIQPWRYPPENLIKYKNRTEVNPDLEDVNLQSNLQHCVTREHIQFIAENLLAYVVIFQQLLPRFARVDLISPKMSCMLYRLTKVFNQRYLPMYLKEIEHSVENNLSPSHKYNAYWAQRNLPPLSPTTTWSTNLENSIQMNNSLNLTKQHFQPLLNSTCINPGFEKKWSSIVRQKIYELEGTNFFYRPLFSNPPASEVYDLIVQIKRSIIAAEELVRLKAQEEAELYGGFFGFFKKLWHVPAMTDEFSLTDRQKVPAYLNASLQNLMEMFQITEIRDFDPEPSPVQSQSMEFSDNLKFLTPERVRNRIKNIKYEGDPDLHPIRSNENTFLVRTLYQISERINEQFRGQFYRCYNDPTITGRFCRQLLCPPITVWKFDKTLQGSPRVTTNLPPRVSLRPLASYNFLIYFFFGAFIGYLLGYSFSSYVIVLIAVFFFYKFLKAIPRDGAVRHNYPTEGFGNISFNDSF